MTFLRAAPAAGLAALVPGAVTAQALEVRGEPTPGAMGLQPPGGELARDFLMLDDIVLYITGGIVVFVLLLLVIVILRYNSRANPTPSQFSHNPPLEVAWTVIPVLILLFIGTFSGPILKKQQTFPAGDVVVKVTGNQWYWSYEYPEEGIGPFDSYMIGGLNLGGDARLTPEVEAELKDAGYEKEHFLLAADTAIVVPVNKKILLQITGADVIHSWTVPAFTLKQDAVPGRIAHAWFQAEHEGVYFGQCSELCGKDHAFMPINVKVVSEDAYDDWVKQAQAGDVVFHAPIDDADDATEFAAND